METISINSVGPAVEDVQQRLVTIGLLDAGAVDGAFGEQTAAAVRAFCTDAGLPASDEVTEKVWAALVDASYHMGDRTLYLHMPYFHGNDVLELQNALGALGFSVDYRDGIFGASTEHALRRFQVNLGLPTDGIAGAQTFAAIRNLHHSWEGKPALASNINSGFARAADVLEKNTMCLFGTTEFTRDVASRMSNLGIATNPASKIVSAESLLVKPDESMLLVHILLPEEQVVESVPRVEFESEDTLALRMLQAIKAARRDVPKRIAIELPGSSWEDAGESRSAQHFAIALLDALCLALEKGGE